MSQPLTFLTFISFWFDQKKKTDGDFSSLLAYRLPDDLNPSRHHAFPLTINYSGVPRILTQSFSKIKALVMSFSYTMHPEAMNELCHLAHSLYFSNNSQCQPRCPHAGGTQTPACGEGCGPVHAGVCWWVHEDCRMQELGWMQGKWSLSEPI